MRVSVPLRDADDLAQDVFAQACATRHQFSGDNVGPWLYQIARNKIAAYYRRKSVELQSLKKLNSAKNETGDFGVLTDDFDNFVSNEQLHVAIDSLDEIERDALRLKFSMSYSNTEIATLLKMTPGNLGVVLFRAIRKLRHKLNPVAAGKSAQGRNP
jgi:RNA polymerase sigma factor (sigma-70 family)